MLDLGSHVPSSLDDGRYIVGELLGQGGMAVVCTAFDRSLGVDRAVKILVPGSAARATVRRRLKAEARAMARLQHPNILAIHDVGVEGDLDYVIMDLADGGSLQNRVEAGPLEPDEALRIMVQVLSALAAAHAAGIVHRDVKPHNILVDHNGRALLADFGIALLSDDERRTRTGVAMGSLAYMPPEQRLDAARVGPSADIYAAGTTLYALLTAENPVDLFLADTESARWTRVPDPIRPILQRACQRLPEDRWPNAAAMAGAIADLLHTTLVDTPAPAPSVLRPIPSPARVPTHTPTHDATSEALEFLSHHVTETAGELALNEAMRDAVAAELGARPTPTPAPAARARPVPAPALAPTELAGGPPAERLSRTVPMVLGIAGSLAIALVFLWLGIWLAAPGGGRRETPVGRTDGSVATVSGPVPTPSPAMPTPVVPEPVVPEPVVPGPSTALDPDGSGTAPTPDPVPFARDPVPPPPLPVVTPRPVVASPTPAPAPEPTASGVSGRWSGSMGGIVVDLDLTTSGPSASGTLTTTFGPNIQTSALRGTWDGRRRALDLADADPTGPSAARYELVYDATADRLDGKVVKNAGGMRPLTLRRAP
ncbi:MAG: protein kinase [Myxococcota bacterium]